MRSYNETFTWLQFKTLPQSLPPLFWQLSGKVLAGLKQLNGAPLPVADARALERELVVAGSQARLALDGIVLPLETIQKLTKARSASSASTSLSEVEAYQSGLAEATRQSAKPLDTDAVQRIHRTMTERTGEEERPGHWRVQPTGGKAWEGVPEEVIGVFTEELCDRLRSDEMAAPGSGEADAYGLWRMLTADLYLAWIRPFSTAHFRVSAGVEAHILRAVGIGPNAVHLLSIALHRNAREFSRQVQQASEGAADHVPFLLFALRSMADVLDELLARIREVQARGQWRAQLLELFQEGNDEPTRRQRQVLLDLAGSTVPVRLNQLSALSPTLARLYAGVSEKTMRRDVEALLLAGVLRRGPEGLHVDLSNILAFKDLPS